MNRLILASASPRRKELLEQMGLDFEIIPGVGEEIITKENPEEIVEELSLQKASEVAERLLLEEGMQGIDLQSQESERDVIIIGSDTIVVLNQEIMGKPRDEADAFRMLKALQGNTHMVYTGVTILVKKGKKQSADGERENSTSDRCITFADGTAVTMYPMTDQQIYDYIATKEPMDKAGAYAIQGKCAVNIEKICGEYNTVVGLPIARLYQELRKAGLL